MNLLLVGAGGVGESIVKILSKRDPKGAWLKKIVIADYNFERAKQVAGSIMGDASQKERILAEKVDARKKEQIIELARKHDIDFIMDAATPDFMKNIFDAALEAGCDYQNMGVWSMANSEAPFDKPFEEELGEYNFNKDEQWRRKGCMALLGMGIDPGVVDVFARFAADKCFDEIQIIDVKDANNLVVEGVDVAFGFSIETTFQELTGPNYVWEKDKGYTINRPFTGKEEFVFPEIGTQTLYYCEHEEVCFMPKYLSGKGLEKCTFKIAVDDNLMNALKAGTALGLYDPADEGRTVNIDGVEISPLTVVGKTAPNPITLGEKMTGKMCVGVNVIGKKDGQERNIFMYQILDNAYTMKEYGCQVVVAQTGLGAAIGIELIAKGVWKKAGVHAPEAFDPIPYLKLMKEYNFPFAVEERDSEYKRVLDNSSLEKMLG